jgi:hypothetical protein
MKATPEKAWSAVSDITNTGKFSPETFEAEWLDGATGPAVGAKFRGHVKRNGRGPVYWTTCEVIECEPGRSFAFNVIFGGYVANTWRYTFAPSGDGVDVTESYELPNNVGTKVYALIAGKARNRTNVNGMRETLERVKAFVE